MAQRGGRRAGSGRKQKPVKQLQQDLDSVVRNQIAEKAPDLLANLFHLADGVLLERSGKDGSVAIFATGPDRAANEYLLNRLLGKPTERHEHDFSDLSNEEILARLQGASH